MISIVLPYPPSVNAYWRHIPTLGRSKYSRGGVRVLISERGREYRTSVGKHVRLLRLRGPLTARLAISIDVFPPDHRRRDLDNALKAILDSLQAAGVFEDDEQIDQIAVMRREVVPPGRVKVELLELPA